jgi:hypothetical protein
MPQENVEIIRSASDPVSSGITSLYSTVPVPRSQAGSTRSTGTTSRHTLSGLPRRVKSSVVVPTTCDGPADRSKNPQDEADNGKNRAERVEDADVQQRPDDDEDDSENDHYMGLLPASPGQ